MPFGDIRTPSLALSLLKAGLARVGVPSSVHYLGLDFAERIGLERYDRYMADQSGGFLGEWIFSDCLIPRREREVERYVEDVLIPLERFGLEEIAGFERDRAAAGPFLEECLRSRDWGSFRAIGFTTTFQQNTASLAFARMLKQAHPGVAILFGGANCEGPMGAQLLESFPWIDFVCTGEGDDVVPQLALELAGRRPPGPIPGILRRDAGPGPPVLTHPPTVTDLDRLPFPEFSDYFERLRVSPFAPVLRPRVTLETSRGCWWGEKHHCTFCGLNGLTMRFRSKSPGRAREEIVAVATRYGTLLDPSQGIFFADNILDMNYFRSVLPALRDAGLGVTLFYETKANLTREQVRLLADSGIREIQPGIESLHTDLLRLMRKGCTGLQNIQLLKWCRSFGIKAHWNLLYGFPDEDPGWFDDQAAILPRISHLDAPRVMSPVRLDRFSPLFSEAGARGITNVRPARALTWIFPLPAEEVGRLAYHFDFDFVDGRDPARYTGNLLEAVRRWRRIQPESFFFGFPWKDDLLLWDERGSGAPGHRLLNASMRGLYEFCDRVRSRQEIHTFAVESLGMSASGADDALAEWTASGLTIAEGDRFLALAVVLEGAVAPRILDLDAPGGPVSAAEVPGSGRPLRRTRIRSLTLPDATLVLDREAGRAVVLTGLAAAIWATLDAEPGIATSGREASGLGRGTPMPEGPDAARVIAALAMENLVRFQSG